MKLLIEQVTIADPLSPYNGYIKDILVEDGFIVEINDSLQKVKCETIKGDGFTASPGWVDFFAHFADPGYEYKETLQTGAAAAAAGGYTNVLILPNTKPVLQSKAEIEYIVNTSKKLPVNVFPIGAISKNAEGKDLAEMYDMRTSGSIAFSDGLNPIQTPGLLLKALQYVKAFKGVLIQMPVDASINSFGLMNEGITSTQLGLPGIPNISEELVVSRDIELVKYTRSRLHITGITTSKSVQLISEAKELGYDITCSVTPYHLFFCDEDLAGYNTNLKVSPPIRSREDMMALRTAVETGAIDCIATHHLPQNNDSKVCEFEYAFNGMIGLESCFSVINTLFPNLTTERLIDLMGGNARRIFSIDRPVIKEGAIAEITLFEKESQYIFEKKHIKSRSSNSAFIGKQLKGKVKGTISKDNLYLNE